MKLLRLKRKEDGAAAVEFAIVAALLFMILFGIIEFGIVFNRFQGLQAGAREGARIASLQDTPVYQIMDRVRSSVAMIDVANANQNCPTPSTSGQYCITLTGPGISSLSATDTAPCGSTNGFSNTSGSCAALPCNTAGTVTVAIVYKMKISIPLWASPTASVGGTGKFRCES